MLEEQEQDSFASETTQLLLLYRTVCAFETTTFCRVVIYLTDTDENSSLGPSAVEGGGNVSVLRNVEYHPPHVRSMLRPRVVSFTAEDKLFCWHLASAATLCGEYCIYLSPLCCRQPYFQGRPPWLN